MTLTKELDLHSIRHIEVQTVMDKFLGDHMMYGTEYVTIITGGSEKMKEIVKGVLDDYGLEPEEGFINTGSLNVKL